ncbi:hypothetical protein ACFFUT_17015 [Pseudohalocynthiibacter aestuariivivens]|jgi:hypothetical protein|uniref:D-galactarate dehydratase n=1 Tax=Pseudohalocynthiibacter aestuariivivens TaxID=1591409 RepID=A0ABV5JJ66_9RHOB|nr:MULTISPECIES: hypothetical protein [Pseudohalocynthiibacter]MBS9716725.1 hypothetical protein [Pseudohalocynthiibacter aestuariivivens]MCK0101808.1 hypothetical protein [Pseudohalocynthiibacter sp. F2068]
MKQYQNFVCVLSLGFGLSGCGQEFFEIFREDSSASEAGSAPRPAPRPDDTGFEDARTPEDFDTTTAAERQAAAGSASQGERVLGSTVVSLGDPTEAGFWLKTPLVNTARAGRVYYGANGRSVNVDLLPIDGAGSRISLAAMRLLDAPLASLPEVTVYAR